MNVDCSSYNLVLEARFKKSLFNLCLLMFPANKNINVLLTFPSSYENIIFQWKENIKRNIQLCRFANIMGTLLLNVL